MFLLLTSIFTAKKFVVSQMTTDPGLYTTFQQFLPLPNLTWLPPLTITFGGFANQHITAPSAVLL